MEQKQKALVRIGHGIGNRLFQYASIKGIAAKLGYSFQVLENTVDTEHEQRTYDWFLQRIAIDLSPPAAAPATANTVIYNQPDAEHIGVETNLDFMRLKQLRTNQRPTFDNILFNGYFQSEANFAHIKSELSKMLCDESADITRALDNWETQNGIFLRRCIAIHIRLGDYLVKRHHFIPLQKYYERCITRLRMELDDGPIHFVIVCEEPEKIDEVYPEFFPFIKKHEIDTYTIAKQTQNQTHPVDPVEFDLYLMARCAGIVCSNSTFAWWAAWIGLNREDLKSKKYVYVPNKWLHGNPNVITMEGATVIEC